MSDNYIGVGKGNATGTAYLYTAPLGTALPTDASTALAEAYTKLALIDDEGVTDSVDSETNELVDWSGEVVATAEGKRSETLKYNLVETSMAAMKEAYGDDAVTGTEDKFTVDHKTIDRVAKVYVFEVLLSKDRIKRIVVPNGKVDTLDDITYAPGEFVKYPITLKCLKTADYPAVREFVETITSNGGE